MTGPLFQKHILTVEDEPLVAMLLEDMLEQEGAIVVGPSMRLDQAMELAQTRKIDAAILDVNLGGQNSFALAELLKERGVPHLFVTGYGESVRSEAQTDAPILAKPFRVTEVRDVLVRLLSETAGR
ncbi:MULTISPECIES: response regulator [Rhodomicrobium]|uniref:response regulator n=1 Tax=Rhodomicrobium TaxID=1068 RepID=UPI000B4B1BDA|nr:MULTISPECIES: response regulator [Rhodomicrobium]